MNAKLPIINLELSSGVFRIKTTDAVYQISVVPSSSLTKVVEKVVEKEIEQTSAWDDTGEPGVSEGDEFYRTMSEELYREVGKLARNLSLSIKEIPSSVLHQVDIETTGQELEDAKGQLEDIVQMTEKATMDIMDLSEAIQEDLNLINNNLASIEKLGFMTENSDGDDWPNEEPQESGNNWEASPPPAPSQDHLLFIDRLITQEAKLRDLVVNLPLASADIPAEPAPPLAGSASEPATATVYKFDTDVVFQTLYELCTNEAVKDHIKAMRAEQGTAFDSDIILKTLTDLVPTVEVEDNFFNFPIAGILKGLFQATSSERYKQVLKKMNQTVASIFLDTVLPVEGQVEEQATPANEPAPSTSPVVAASSPAQTGLPAETIETLQELIDANLTDLRQEKERLADLLVEREETSPVSADNQSSARIDSQDRDHVIASISDTAEIVDRVMANITKILEALSFQDLSGQRIQKIVNLIGEIQVQLLSLLVTFGSRIKKQRDGAGPEAMEEREKLAQSEVDKMLERVTGTPSKLEGPDAAGRLDQNAVNNLLEDLGF